MSGWVYVLELSPVGYIKVGQTTKLPDRLTAHLRSVGMAGTHVSRVFSVACNDPEAKEREILRRLAALPDAELVNGREVFEGVDFLTVASLADQVAGKRYKRRVKAGEAAAAPTRTQQRIAEVFERYDADWLPTRLIVAELEQEGLPLTTKELARQLSWSRSRRPWDGVPQVWGYERLAIA